MPAINIPLIVERWKKEQASIWACNFCAHANMFHSTCKHPEHNKQDQQLARSSGGFCGPEAQHLSIPGVVHIT